MAYLHLPRIIFSGDFISDVSTVNNDPAHYNNKTFKPSFQEYGEGSKNGWWNPEGGATFDFKDCLVKRVTYSNGEEESPDMPDGLKGRLIKSFGGRSAGKMVDLDPQQQGVSELWAVKLEISKDDGTILLTGDIVVTAFRDLQRRQYQGSEINGQPLGASWTSVIENIVWAEESWHYRVLRELRERTHGNRLSVNLNAFGYYYRHAADGRFSLGRIIGAIGPWYEGEPFTFISERRLFATKLYPNPAKPLQNLTFFGISNFCYRREERRLTIDLGNSFPIADPMGSIDFHFPILIGFALTPIANEPSEEDVIFTPQNVKIVGEVNYYKGKWLTEEGGILDFYNIPQELAERNQLILMRQLSPSTYSLIARESINGLNVRAEEMVVRLDTFEKKQVSFFAKRWGLPLEKGEIKITLDPPTMPESGDICEIPGIGYPENGLSFSTTQVPIIAGVGKLIITGNKIHNPRGYIDGQIYFIGYQLSDTRTDKADISSDAISVHLRDYFPIPDQPKWKDIAYTMQQFSNLYPIMSKYIVDLGNREAVLSRKDILYFAFSQDLNSPIYMPVTRDLSEGKRKTILKWLDSNGIHDSDESIVNAIADTSKNEIAEEPYRNYSPPSSLYQKLSLAMKMKMGQQI